MGASERGTCTKLLAAEPGGEDTSAAGLQAQPGSWHLRIVFGLGPGRVPSGLEHVWSRGS